MKLSACMIAKNEEQNIGRCINSYKNIVDEIIVIDTGSTDKTAEIARELGASVYSFCWINDFAAAKNYALSKVQGEWIIFLDADEYFDAKLAVNLRKYLRKINKTDFNAVACNMLNLDNDRGRVLNTITQVRILRNNRKIRYINKIHEELKADTGSLKVLFLEPSQLVIYHTGYSAALSKEKAKRNLAMLLKELEQSPSPRLYHYLSDAYLTLNQYENSQKYAELLIDANLPIPGYDSKAYQNIVLCMVELGYSLDEVIQFIEQCIKKFPHHPAFRLYLARSQHRRKEYTSAIEEYKKVIVLQSNYKDIEINFVSSILHEVHFYLGTLYELKNDYSEAIASYTASLKVKSDYAEAFQSLIYIVKGQSDEDVISLLNSIYDPTDCADVGFLVDQLSKFKLGKILFYYTNIWMKKFGRNDLTLIFAFLANRKYDKAYELFSKCYFEEYSNWSAIFAIESAILSENDENVSSIRDHVKPSFRRILDAFRNPASDITLIETDVDDYTALLGELIYIGNEQILTRFLKLQEHFITNIAGVVGNILFEQRCYLKAISQYLEYLQTMQLDAEIESEYFFNIAYCYYKLENYAAASEYFEKACQSGYSKHDLFEFQQWIMNVAK